VLQRRQKPLNSDYKHAYTFVMIYFIPNVRLGKLQKIELLLEYQNYPSLTGRNDEERLIIQEGIEQLQSEQQNFFCPEVKTGDISTCGYPPPPPWHYSSYLSPVQLCIEVFNHVEAHSRTPLDK
jgi:hypothetical protein